MRLISLILALFVLLAAHSIAFAQENTPSRIEVSGGQYDINDNFDTWEARLDYKFGTALVWDIHPFVGVTLTGDDAVYGYAGLAYDWEFANNWYFIPSFAAGAYADGDGKDLGHAIEFRSQVGFAYEFENQHRLGAFVSHISNASLDDKNPGTEEAVLTYSIPVQ